MNLNASSKFDSLKANISEQINMFVNNILHISDNVGTKLFQEILKIEVVNLVQKIEYQIDTAEQEYLLNDEEMENESSSRDVTIQKAECLIKMQQIWATISKRISNTTGDGESA